MEYNKSLFIFRRDLRLEDNTGLTEALESSGSVVPCFIFDRRQVKDNEYKSRNAVQFMTESLSELDSGLKKKKSHLCLFHGIAEDVVKNLLENSIDAVFLNRDYTPFSRRRDKAISKACKKKGAAFHSFSDALLHEPGEVLKDDGTPYSVFSYFMKKARKKKVRNPARNRHGNYFQGKIKGENGFPGKTPANSNIYVNGGRSRALRVLRKIKQFRDYEKKRDYPALDATTGLSAHNKFGTISTREFYYAVAEELGKDHGLIDELYWRDFFTHVAWFFPRVFGHAFRPKYDKLKWSRSRKNFTAWCGGKTGFPIVDAGMRQLNRTGFMHNRARMVTASFLVKDLGIDWRKGEKYFATKLVDYDPAVNNGNWQWAASTGTDAQPYFRIFNPWSQQKRYDPDCAYIKKWIPELEGLGPKEIHNLKSEKNPSYPEPIVKHKKQAKKTKKRYKKIK
ncbi:deoxyribodipyrimidine photo-lyase [Candidatus Micrarchaeota archaeon]|nr:deoxyribodipyrimidine photo-lyase [Candidatus Micrarchaeota archaeon]